ncbi:MAG: exosortase-associated protein EpsI, B-type [Alphaproteobacteria bacterium]
MKASWIWTVAIAMAIAAVAALLMTPRLTGSGTPLVLDDVVPESFAGWSLDKTVTPVLPRASDDEDSLTSRIYDQTVSRTYRNADGERLMLVIAYGRNQSDALQVHRPERCYASLGFDVSKPRRRTISVAGETLPVIGLETRREARHEPVTYWTRVGSDVPSSGLEQQWSRLRVGLQGRIPDGVLIRISSISRQPDEAFDKHGAFIQALIGAIEPAQRSFFLGE